MTDNDVDGPVAATPATTAAAPTSKKPPTDSLTASGSPSALNTPLSSRDPSPARPSQKPRIVPVLTSSRSHEVSPHRPPSLPGAASSTPSAAAIQRALSAATTPQLQPTTTSEPASKLPRAQQRSSAPGGGGAGGGAEDGSSPQWPVSPRLKSDPTQPVSRRNSLQRKPDQPLVAPSIVVQGSTPSSTPKLVSKDSTQVSNLDGTPALQARAAPRDRGASGAPALATVEEGSMPSTPNSELGESQALSGKTTVDKAPSADAANTSDLSNSETSVKRNESGSDSGGKNEEGKKKKKDKKAEEDPERTPRPKVVQPRGSYTSLASIKAKSSAEPASTRKMTVETETVSSNVPPALATGASDRSAATKAGDGGSLRLRPSNETIRPKKDRKKTRKAPSINSGTGMSLENNFHHHLHHSFNENGRPILRPRSQTSPSSPVGAWTAASTNLQSYWSSRFPSPDSSESHFSYLQFFSRPACTAPNSSTNIKLRKASSKADIFEAKVASAVDEANNSSDSDETFVYESNPPEQQPRRSRHPSRTPSTTSMASMAADPRTGHRSLATVLNTERGVSGKRSMKFANNPYSSSGADDDSVGAADGPTRSGTVRASGGSGVHHPHMSRHNRGGMGPPAIFTDEDSSPFSQAQKRSGGSRQGSRPTSPRFANARGAPTHFNGNGTSRKNEVFAYDMDGDGADDERTPLIGHGTVRTARSARGSRLPSSARLRHMERAERSRGYWVKRILGCAVMFLMVAMVVLGAVGFFFVTTKPLYDVNVREIRNVLASEQEIMLDVVVEAVNSNLLTINVGDMDVNVFAKSKYVGSEKWWRDHGKPPPPAGDVEASASAARKRRAGASEGDGRANSTIHAARADFDLDWPDPDDPDFFPNPRVSDPQMMLLGRVLEFDNALTFEGSPITRHLHYSVGEFRVAQPGNKTEAGGTERWERVLQHPFQLIIRGVLKYNLPLSKHVIAAPIDASVQVMPDDANGGVGKSGSLALGEFRSNLPTIDGESGAEKSQGDGEMIPSEQSGASTLVRSAHFRVPAVS